MKKQPKKKNSTKIFFDFISIVIALTVLLLLMQIIPGYNWVVNSLILGTYKTIAHYPNITLEQKWALKCGFDYRYLNYIKKQTPKDAIIIMPTKEEIFPEGEKSDFKNAADCIKNKAWATYFLYPRKLVYKYEKGKNPYYAKANYIAIVNYRGYDALDYQIARKEKHCVLPLHNKAESQ